MRGVKIWVQKYGLDDINLAEVEKERNGLEDNMKSKGLINRWCELSENAKVVIVTDEIQYPVAEAVKEDIENSCEIVRFTQGDELVERLQRLSKEDLIIAILSLESFITDGANKIFSPFGKPVSVKARYIFVRLDITKESLLQGLATPKELVYSKIDEMNQYRSEDRLCVKSSMGTNITLKINPFTTCSHEITNVCDYAFLPPSETSADVIEGTANGTIVVDVTVGQFYYYAELLDKFGMVDAPVKINIEDGYVVDITGGDMAIELKKRLFQLPKECRELVELGQGLSDMSPTGLIGVDESIISTCHFGIGDGGKCGLHLDVVIDHPRIETYKE